MKKIILLGCGGGSKAIADFLNEMKEYKCVGYLDDDKELHGDREEGIEVLGSLKDAEKFKDCSFIFGIVTPSNYHRREEILSKTKLPFKKFISLIHPNSYVSKTAKIGRGVIIYPNAFIGNHTHIGNHVHILPNTTINHNVKIGDYTFIASGVQISGNVRIGKSCYLGTGSSIREHLTIEDCVLVGMGSVVVKDVKENKIVVGNPARYFSDVDKRI